MKRFPRYVKTTAAANHHHSNGSYRILPFRGARHREHKWRMASGDFKANLRFEKSFLAH